MLKIFVEKYENEERSHVRIITHDGKHRNVMARSIDIFGLVDLSYIDLDDLLLLTEKAYEAGKNGEEFALHFQEYAERDFTQLK